MKYLSFLIVAFLFVACKKESENSAPLSNKQQFETKVFDTIAVVEDIISRHNPNESIFKIIKGHLDKDDIEDLLVVSESDCDSIMQIENARCRKVYLLIAKGKNTFTIAAENNNIIECNQCGGGGIGDPFQKIEIKTGEITFVSIFGSCDKTIDTTIFKYDQSQNKWLLEKTIREDYTCRQENIEENEIEVKAEIKTKNDFGKIEFSNY